MELRSVAYNPALGMGGMQGMAGMPGMADQGMMGAPGMYPAQEFDPCCPMPCPPCTEPVMKPHAPMPAAAPAQEVYVVKKGDTIYKIAKRYGTTMQAIISANNLRNSNLIYPGQILFIPDAAVSAY